MNEPAADERTRANDSSSRHKSPQAIAAFLCAVVAWSLSWVVDKSCEFVILSSREEDSSAEEDKSFPTLSRGIQRGSWQPGDSCQAWGQYNDDDNVNLPSRMIVARIAAAITIVFGAFIMVWTAVTAMQICSCLKETTIVILHRLFALLSLLCSICQAATHLMVKSDFCEESDLVIVTSDGMEILFDKCSKDTVAYNITFATIVLWLVPMTVLLFGIPSARNQRANLEGTTTKGQELADTPKNDCENS